MKPLVEFDDLLNWEGSDLEEVCLINYSDREFQEKSGAGIDSASLLERNKVLLCHDMQGGYLDDSSRQTNENAHAYRFYNWNLIDIFVYFSHHFITIPPAGWTEHCHRNGVQCLGTVITEGDRSSQFHQLFEKADNVEMVARKLSEIRTFYNFDGWLINIECACQDSNAPATIGNIKFLLRRLVELGNEVYWYDAITESGQLCWQNALTEENLHFFTICGNIFLNYCWSAQSLSKSAEMALGHCHRVFVGIDCFGRGCFGGGGLRCDVACAEIERAFLDNSSRCRSKFSIALFAPGWCWESLPPSELGERLDEHVWSFFTKLEPYLNPWSNGRHVYRQLPPISIGESEFSTNFDIGQGFSHFVNGTRVSEGNYNQLSDQNLMPTGVVSNASAGVLIKLLPTRVASYHGHSCVMMHAECADGESRRSGPCSILVELFRVGCVLDGTRPAVLNLVLGRDRGICPDIDVWQGLQLVLRFNVHTHPHMEVVELPLADMKPHQSVPASPIEWWTLAIEDLSAALLHSLPLTVRKVDMEIVDASVLDYLTRGNIYFGHFSVA